MPTVTLVCCCELLAPGTEITVESHLKWDLRSKDGTKTQNRVQLKFGFINETLLLHLVGFLLYHR